MTNASLKKLLLTGLTLALVIAGATVAFAQLSDDSPSTTTSSTTSTAEDISGPCDEAEHANDPECTGVPTGPGDDDDRVDNSGPGSLNSGPGNAEDEDHSGPGHGGDDDSSGPGSGDDDSSGSGGGDSSGHGSGDDD